MMGNEDPFLPHHPWIFEKTPSCEGDLWKKNLSK
jgi:hypothetical protein